MRSEHINLVVSDLFLRGRNFLASKSLNSKPDLTQDNLPGAFLISTIILIKHFIPSDSLVIAV